MGTRNVPLGFQRRYPNKQIFDGRPVYTALIERLVLDPANHNGFSIVSSKGHHRKVWYAVLDHYGIRHKTYIVKYDRINGYYFDENGQKQLVEVCYNPPGIYHEDRWCQSTCDLTYFRALDISTNEIRVGPYKINEGRHPPCRIYCAVDELEEEDEALSPVTKDTRTLQPSQLDLLKKMHPPILRRPE